MEQTINMTEQEKDSLIALIKAGSTLPKEFIYKLFADEDEVLFGDEQSI